MSASDLAKAHWNANPLFRTEQVRYDAYPWLYDAAEFRHHSGETILEVGCGTGCDLLQFAKCGAIAYGIDITEEHLRLAEQRVGDLARVQYGDGRAIPFPSSTFDFVYSHGVIHHCDQPERMAAEIFRVLKPGGKYNVQVYSLWSYNTAMLVCRFGWKWKLHVESVVGSVHIDLYTARKLRKLFPECKISKFHFPRIPSLASSFGWFIVATGTKH